ncbi:MAG: flagella basal body P-ring formation protein FlgA [Thermodesulfobacterium geofontis]|uniref:Flagella basal body P-ring formation protein FlgA n=1 Tax=Thermodesulfobacterium geofontis TaxID=1295609 RepID=A0A2N7Q855_9BACT|nr:MAG: flagella basal body P-ring formation protein FlgA [Thermodesulfobacterium geofontis]PMP94347.1 MAG: flagella basal body P-ring formation protein FlgA [Thermodesulfobacterium geofontis]
MKKLAVFYIFLMVIFKINICFSEEIYTPEDFKNIFLEEIKKKIPWIKGEFYVERLRIEPESISIPKNLSYKASFIAHPKLGSNLLILEFKNGDFYEKVKIWGYVEAKVPVMVLKRPVLNKAILSEEDITMELKPLSRLPQDVILDKNSALGKQLRMSLKAGTILRYSHIERPVIIRRNQIVYIVVRGKNFVVKAKGLALQDGREGAEIKVKNISSKKILWGKVISSEEVEVAL